MGVLRATALEGSEKFTLNDYALEALEVTRNISIADETDASWLLWNFHACSCRDLEDRLLLLYGLFDLVGNDLVHHKYGVP